jgi:hypothetical protein
MKRKTRLKNLLKVAAEVVTSFDFDDTIRDSITGKLNKDIEKEIINAYSKGKVYLVTARQDTVGNRNFVLNYLLQCNLKRYFDDLFFTGGIKYSKLLELKVTHHYDDNDIESMMMMMMIVMVKIAMMRMWY